MSRLQQITFSISILAIIIIVIALAASELFLPNRKTPIKKLAPNLTESKNPIKPTEKTVAAWVWEYPSEIDDVDQLVSESKDEGLNTLYIYIDEYIDIYELEDAQERDVRMNKYLQKINEILTKSRENNIVVHALSGYTAYSYDSHSYIPLLLVEHVFEFNRQYPEIKFSGIQFDIEFYDDEAFFNNPSQNIENYLNLISNITTKVETLNRENNDNISLGFVIPFWFDTPPSDYFSEPILEKVINRLSVIENSYIVVMAYRDFIEGEGGVMDISNTELKATENTPTKVIIAQEIVENQEEKITHFGKSKNEINDALNTIIDKGSEYQSFGGVSIHDMSALRQLD